VVERRGEVIYYKIDKVNFSQNRNFESPEHHIGIKI
jgi:hypothetical protein